MNQKQWQPARRELVYLALAGMEVCVLVPAVLAASQFAIGLPRERAVPAFLVVILLAFNLVRLMEALDLKSHLRRDIGLVILLFWIGIALRFTLYRHYPWYSLRWVGEIIGHLGEHRAWLQDAVLVVIVLLFWWRGLALAGRPLSVDAVGYYFRAGVLLLAITVVIATRLVPWSSIPFVLGYFFLGLVAIALARAEEVGRWRTGLPFPFSAGWLLSVVAAAGASILIAIVLISLFTGENLVQVLSRLGPVWEIVSYLIAGLMTLVVMLLTPLITAVVNWLMQVARNAGVTVPDLTLQPGAEREPGDTYAAPMIDLSLYEPILRGLLIAFAILVVALAFGRLWRARSQLGTVRTEPVRGQGARGAGLADRARKGLRSLVGQIGFLNRWYTAVSIRRIYAQMVATAGRRGYPRAGSETPFEYLSTLTGAWPDLSSQFGSVTHAYVRVHYGEIPETEEELEAIRAAWRQIQSAG